MWLGWSEHPPTHFPISLCPWLACEQSTSILHQVISLQSLLRPSLPLALLTSHIRLRVSFGWQFLKLCLKSKKESQESGQGCGLIDLFLHTLALIPKEGELTARAAVLLPLGWVAAEGGAGQEKRELRKAERSTYPKTQSFFNDAKNTTCQKSTLISEGNNSYRSSTHSNKLANEGILGKLKSQL